MNDFNFVESSGLISSVTVPGTNASYTITPMEDFERPMPDCDWQYFDGRAWQNLTLEPSARLLDPRTIDVLTKRIANLEEMLSKLANQNQEQKILQAKRDLEPEKTKPSVARLLRLE